MKLSLLQKGARAPNFALTADDGSRVTLSESLASGPVVLIFYPGDYTPGCTIQLCAVRDDWAEFQRLGINVFGMNRGRIESHQGFAKQHKLPFRLLSDEGGKVSRAYGTLIKLPFGSISRRTVYGIDAQGIVRYARRGMPKNSEVLKAMKPYAQSGDHKPIT